MNDARPWTRNDGTPSRDLPPGWPGARWPGAPPGLCSARCSPSPPRAPRCSPPRRCATGPSGSTSHTLSLFTTTTIFLHNFRSLCHFHPFWWSPFALNSLGILPWVIAWKCNELLRRPQRDLKGSVAGMERVWGFGEVWSWVASPPAGVSSTRFHPSSALTDHTWTEPTCRPHLSTSPPPGSKRVIHDSWPEDPGDPLPPAAT